MKHVKLYTVDLSFIMLYLLFIFLYCTPAYFPFLLNSNEKEEQEKHSENEKKENEKKTSCEFPFTCSHNTI